MAGVKRNCWTCGFNSQAGRCDAPHAAREQSWPWVKAQAWRDYMPSRDADGCPGWKPKPGAENTDRAQLASLGDSATIRPDSATPTVKQSLTVGLPDDRFLRHSGRRGPGGIMARKLRKL